MARQYVWVEPGGRGRVICGCIGLLAAMVCIDGLLNGELLRAGLGALFAWPFLTFMIRGIPMPKRAVEEFDRQVDKALSTRAGDNSELFRWTMVVLGAILGALCFWGAWAILDSPPVVLDSFLPMVADDIRSAHGTGGETWVRLLYAALFAAAGGAALWTAWVRSKG